MVWVLLASSVVAFAEEKLSGQVSYGFEEGLGDMVALETFKVDEELILLPSCASRVVRWSLICMGIIAALDSPLRLSFES